MDIDIKKILKQDGRVENLVLLDDSKRITCTSFMVYIPSLMNYIAPSKEDTNESIQTNNDLDDNNTSGDVTLGGSYVATNVGPFDMKVEGWIPQFKIDNVTSPDGTTKSIDCEKLIGTTDMTGLGGITAPPVHQHALSQGALIKTANYTKLEMHTLISNTNTEVDLQDIHNIFIKQGNILYGYFSLFQK